MQPIKILKQGVQIDLGQVVLGQCAVHTVVNDLAGADAVAGFQIVGTQAVAGGFLLGGKDHRRAMYVVAAQPAHGAFAQRVVGYHAKKRRIHAKICQCKGYICLAAAVACLKRGGHTDLFVVGRGQAQHDLTDGDELLRAGGVHQNGIGVFHNRFLRTMRGKSAFRHFLLYGKAGGNARQKLRGCDFGQFRRGLRGKGKNRE